jgi:type VI secretion system protein ImpJ
LGRGLLLRPQHFQRQDQYHEQRLHKSIKAVHPYAWGVERLQVDRDALASNVLRILDLALRFQDGELVDAPGVDALPDTVDLSLLQQQAAGDHLLRRPARPETVQRQFRPAGPGDGDTTRFVQSNQETPDLYTQAAPVQLSYLKKTVRLVSEFEPRDAYIHFPLLRLRRAASGGFEIDGVRAAQPVGRSAPAAVPAAAPPARRAAGQGQRPVWPSPRAEPQRDRIPLGRHVLVLAAAHGQFRLRHADALLQPSRPASGALHEQLLGVAGGLMTFSKLDAGRPAALPARRSGRLVQPLFQIIRELLDTVISSKYFAIVLSEVRPSYHHGVLDSGKIDDKTTFYIAVSADIPALELVDTVPLRFKVGGPDDVEKCVLSALPGVRLQYAPQLPAAVPVRPDTCYFILDAKGQMYERMLQAQSISIYVPSGMKELKLELLAVAA